MLPHKCGMLRGLNQASAPAEVAYELTEEGFDLKIVDEDVVGALD